jgi:hypothetical protein
MRLLLVCVTFSVYLQGAPQLPVVLGSTSTYSVLGASTVTSTGPTVVNGDLGLSPGTAVTGFPPGQVVGNTHVADGPAGVAQNDLTTAYLDAQGRTIPTVVAGDLGGTTLAPGLYKSTSSLGITGVVTLDAQGNPNAVFIFQISTALTTATGSQVKLVNGAQAANIFWQVGSSATLGTYSLFNGTILAQASIMLTTGAALNGRALARTGAVTLDSNTITNPGPAGGGGTLSAFCPASFAQIGVAYNSIASATGGTPPYTFSIMGALPPSLVLTAATGAITGPLTGSGGLLYSFTVNVSDSAAGSATKGCSISVLALAPLATPAPSSLILVLIGFACTGLYYSRGRIFRMLGRG